MSVNDDSLTVGIELEFSQSTEHTTTFSAPAVDSHNINEELDYCDWHAPGRCVYDATAGAEAVSPRLDEDNAESWFAEALDEFRTFGAYEPCGYAANNNRASSFGLHIHLSRLTQQEAQTLADYSSEPWLQLLVCSSIAKSHDTETYQVFRDNYCNLNFDQRRYSVVNGRGDGHYEWRLPEPMTEANFGIMMDFIKKFKHGSPYEAKEWAKGIVESADDRLTSVRRIQEVGLEAILDDNDDEDDSIVPDGTTTSRSYSTLFNGSELFESINNNHERPYIYHVEVPDKGRFFGFATNRYDDTEEFEDDGLTYSVQDVIDAKKRLIETNPRTVNIVNAAIEEERDNSGDAEPIKTAATDRLASIVNE